MLMPLMWTSVPLPFLEAHLQTLSTTYAPIFEAIESCRRKDGLRPPLLLDRVVDIWVSLQGIQVNYFIQWRCNYCYHSNLAELQNDCAPCLHRLLSVHGEF